MHNIYEASPTSFCGPEANMTTSLCIFLQVWEEYMRPYCTRCSAKLRLKKYLRLLERLYTSVVTPLLGRGSGQFRNCAAVSLNYDPNL